jgi:hypothetical protein
MYIMELLVKIMAAIAWISQRLWETASGTRQMNLLVHNAYFTVARRECYFLNATNLSRDREVEITHVWFALDPQIHAQTPDRPLPKRLRPDETWETWVESDRLPSDLGEKIFTLGRAHLANGREVKSRKNKHVPSQGTVPGGPIAGAQR